MPEYWDCCGKWVWPNGEPENWEDTWEPAQCHTNEHKQKLDRCAPICGEHAHYSTCRVFPQHGARWGQGHAVVGKNCPSNIGWGWNCSCPLSCKWGWNTHTPLVVYGDPARRCLCHTPSADYRPLWTTRALRDADNLIVRVCSDRQMLEPNQRFER
jgi:hypothetical protein